jgi:Matrixin
LRAFQTWAVNSNINIGLVNDGGEPMGAPGMIQGDPRFGAIRVAGSTGLTPEVVAIGDPFNWSLGTASGDVVFNTNQDIGINTQGKVAGQYDLFSVALHEAGHVFGLADETSNPASVMYTQYQGPVSGLSATDIASLQAIYGAPTPDANQSNGGNGSLARAVPVTLTANTVVSGNLRTIGQQEYFSVSVPAGKNLVVTLHTAGLSLLIPSLSIYNSSGSLLASTATPSNHYWTQDISQNFGAQPTAKTYYIEVSSPVTSVFGMGAFQLDVGYNNPPPLASPVVNQDGTSNSTLPAATQLVSTPGGINTYLYYATMKDTSGSHFYQFATPATANNTTEAMLVSVNALQSSNSPPGLHVYSSSGTLQPYQVLTSSGQTYTVQLTGIAPGSTYYVQTTQQSPNSQQAPASYSLTINFAAQAATPPVAVGRNTLGPGNLTDSGTLALTQAALVQFALSANVGSSTVPVNVTMTVTNSAGQTLFSLTALSGQPPVTIDYYLGAGTYSVTYQASLVAGAPAGSVIPAVVYELDAGVFSQPQGAYFTNTSTSSGTTVLTYSGALQPGGTQYYY